ncbi:MAG: hypothetical protein ACYTF7_04115 [Planctomycetota bacterium]|jgi:hypothetical protein
MTRITITLAALLLAAATPTQTLLAQPEGEWEKEAIEDVPEANYTPLSEEDAIRYRHIATQLVKHIVESNPEEYRKLFTDEGWEESIPWWHQMFSAQRDAFGPIIRAYAPTRKLLRASDVGVQGPFADGAAFVIQFEDSGGGLLSIKLNDENKIEATDVFVIGALGEYQDTPENTIYDAYAKPAESNKP